MPPAKHFVEVDDREIQRGLTYFLLARSPEAESPTAMTNLELVSKILIGLVALTHIYILILEMFLWTKPTGLKTFRMSEVQAQTTKVLAANQGLYNGFLAAGLIWALVYPSAYFGRELALFFLGCVVVAALYGSHTVGKRIFFVQGLPALLAFLTTLFVSF